MKFIVNLTEEVLLLRGMPIGQHHKMRIVNEEILEWQETKELLAQRKIKITEEN